MKKSAILIIVAALLLSSGCTSNFEIDEDVVKEVSDKITKTIINSVGKEEFERYETHAFDAAGINEINIDSAVGSINVYSHESKEIIVNLTIKANSSTKEKAQELAENYIYTAEQNQSSIDVDTSNKDFDIPDGNGVETRLEILLPPGVENITVSLNVGDINIKDIAGKFEVLCNVGSINIEGSHGYYDLQTDVGNISVKDSSVDESSEFTVNTGDLKLNLVDISNADKIKATAGVGKVEMNLPKNSNYEVTINEFMKEERTETSGDGTTEITLTSGVGNVELK